MSNGCDICGTIAEDNEVEPRFGYTTCQEHKNIPPSERGDYDSNGKNARMEILLRAFCTMAKKLEDSRYQLDFFEQTAIWDTVECDGYCLYEEAKEILGIEEE